VETTIKYTMAHDWTSSHHNKYIRT